VPRYRKLGYVAINVSDVARARSFYETMVGLAANGEGAEGEAFLRCGADHHAIVLYPAAPPGLKRIGFEIEDRRELDLFADRLEREGIAPLPVDTAEAAALRQSSAFRITDPFTGATLEFYAGMEPARVPFVPTLARIQRIGHVVMRVADLDGAVDFYTRKLGFRISDAIEGQACFMRCHPSPYHHGIGLFQGKTAQLHHVNFMVSEMADIDSAIARFRHAGVRIVYGPGRHRPSGSFYVYFHEPDGLTLEYSYDMEEFPEADARAPRIFESPRESDELWRFLKDPELYRGIIERDRDPTGGHR
jgi:2,3-dihydroxy-p-cumate/2,3-dihydroxybenzoate 3,4-dioxygenase